METFYSHMQVSADTGPLLRNKSRDWTYRKREWEKSADCLTSMRIVSYVFIVSWVRGANWCWRMDSPEAETETEFGAKVLIKDQCLRREEEWSRIGQKFNCNLEQTEPLSTLQKQFGKNEFCFYIFESKLISL